MLIKRYAPLMAYCLNKCALFDLDLWTSDPKITGDSLLPRMNRDAGGLVKALPSLLILIGNGLSTLTHLTLTFDLMNIISIGFLCYPGWMCGLSLRRLFQGVIKLLIWNNKGYRRTNMWKAICPLFIPGGHKNRLNMSIIN